MLSSSVKRKAIDMPYGYLFNNKERIRIGEVLGKPNHLNIEMESSNYGKEERVRQANEEFPRSPASAIGY
jgi:hypothetical protein